MGPRNFYVIQGRAFPVDCRAGFPVLSFLILRDVVQSSAHRVDNESVASLETKPLNYCLNAVDAQNVQSNQDLL